MPGPSSPTRARPDRAAGALADLATALDRARLAYWEQPETAMEVAIRCAEQGRTLDLPVVRARALALQGAITLHGGDLQGAAELAEAAGRETGDDLTARAELAALATHLHFFSGAYTESLREAHAAVALADADGRPELRLHARRMACVAFGNLGVDDWPQRLEELLALAVATDSRWEQAIAHNDLGHLRMAEGDLEGAAAELERGLALARAVAPHHRFALGVLHCTRAELHLTAGDPHAGLADAEQAIANLFAARDVNPYLLAMSVLVRVQALLTLDRVEDARQAGEVALERLGDRVPQARSMILGAVAGALREAGRPEEAYDALARGAALEREAMQQFAQLRLGLERARLESAAARREADALSAKNRELEALVDQLADLQAQLREQADRDWLTGLHNRRFLARARAEGRLHGPLAVAVLDLDHFKAINDGFGHQAGDRVLARVGAIVAAHAGGDAIAVRAGGEEFALYLPGTRAPDAAARCEILRAAIAAEPWPGVAAGLRVTASIGLACAPAAGDLEALEREADSRLYAAKAAGRDRVVTG